MSKKLKLYVPVISDKRKVILIGVHNCSELQKEIPIISDIYEHLVTQHQIVRQGGQFTSIKIGITPSRFKELQKELSFKLGGSFRNPTIDMVFELGQSPIIQISGSREETKNE